MTAQTWLARAGGLVTIAILTRLLAPEDFGLLAIASTLLTLTYVLSDLGLSTYVVQAATIDRRSLSTAFWVSLLGGGMIALAIYLLAPGIAALLRAPGAEPILQAMTVIVVLISLTSVPLALMRRRMQFRLLAFQFSAGAILAQIVAIVAAFSGWGVWALVLQLVVGQLVASVTQWISARWHPSWEFSRPDFGIMVRYGVHVVGSGLVNVGRTWIETGIVAAGLGIRELGYLNIAQKLVQTATELSGTAILPVSTVAFAKVKSSITRLRDSHARATALAQAIVTPAMVLIVVSAPVLVPLVFGPEWGPSAPVAQLLALAALLAVGREIDHGLLDGVGRPGRWLAFTTVICTLSVGLIALGVPYSVLVIAGAYLVVALVELVGRWFVVGRFLQATVLQTAMPFLMVLPAAIGSALAGLASVTLLRTAPELLTIAATGLVVLAVHLGIVRLLTPATWTELVALIPGRGRGATPETSAEAP
ncbi:MAG: lipopolysaccharide biosynthesis protein [Propionibacteriaceae bacterium]|nr:lipopolysaccharide biosynthesis protein [Propionibacteriaceae bacterium]